ncbi:MAG: S-adenosyl-l-methionine hydroxide adenosyltransferase family protein [Woeseiaceae bacterium]|jgi:S-adenosylmethionine hydrolase|nr:S-adenosyl-l-methionine hydroxide adenosyltransferase family protein [Woeseiaceae bacterium]MDG1864515.1 S-adenosyl-l-methionine hydroxide adenosyltransferase family protein [Woeseiaceae bacterium]
MLSIRYASIKISLIMLLFSPVAWTQNALVFQTDFGLEEPAVSQMKGVAFNVSSDLKMFDITHEIPRFNIWEAAYRLNQAADYWPKGTVFVSVVDPGVGTQRKSVVLETKSGHFFVSPDNGSLTLVADKLGIQAVREINEKVNRLKGSERSHTFHGRDVYAYTGARLASEVINFSQVGDLLDPVVLRLEYTKPQLQKNKITGNIPILDTHYGNVWTNISIELFDQLEVMTGDFVWIKILTADQELFSQKVKFASSFGQVELGEPVIYVNDILNIGIALNQGDMAKTYNISAGSSTTIEIWK